MAVYARVPATRQAQAQTIEQQLDRLREAVAGRGWELGSGMFTVMTGIAAPAWAARAWTGCGTMRRCRLDLVLITAPDRLARNYVHQVLLIDELARRGCRVEFLDRPMSSDPHDQLLLQIRGAVAEYERTLIAERMRRGRQARLRAGGLLPWTSPGVRGPGGALRGGTGRAAVRPVPGARGHRRPARPAADRSGSADPDGQARLERGQRARHLA